MSQDLRFALRMIASHRWFSAAVVVTLALGIGLNTMVFTLVNAALFKAVPVPGGENLVSVRNQNLSVGTRGINVSYRDFLEYRSQTSALRALEASSWDQAVLSEKGNPPQLYAMNRVSSGLFEMLHIPPVLGRGFLPDDTKPGAEPVVLLGYGLWKDRYANSPDVVGRHVRVNEKPATIIGVMPEGFKFPDNQDLWMPLVVTPELEDRANRSIQLFGMRKPGVSIAQATADLQGIAVRLAAAYPEANKGVGILVETFPQRYNGGPIRVIFLLMLAAVGLVLLIVCANVANMMLSRALGRQREMSIRAALGASRWQVIRQLLIESIVLSVLGGVLGLGLAVAGVHWFDLVTQNVGKPYWVQFTMDYTVFGYFAALCLFSGLLFGLAPAIRSSRSDLNTALKDGTRSATTQRGGTLSTVLVICQFALTLVLLTGAGVFIRSFLDNLALNQSVPAKQLLTARIRLPKQRYETPEARSRFFDQLLPRLGGLPGVTHIGLVSNLPGLGAGGRQIETEDAPVAEPKRAPSATVIVQVPGYFDAINLPVLAGRDFDATDGAAGKRSAIVAKEFADRYWPKQMAVGKRFRFITRDKPGEWITVVGVSANLVQEANETSPNPLLFLPYRQEGYDSMALIVRSSGNASLAGAVRSAVQNMDQDLPLFEVSMLTEAVERNRWFLRVFGLLFSGFGLTALLIASVGIYAVIAQATSRRTQEIGVRMALGATSGHILTLILGRGLKQLIAGLALGLAAAFPVTRVMSSLPLRLSPSDPVVFLSVSLLLSAVGLFACWLPARRAAALNPVNAIRYE